MTEKSTWKRNFILLALGRFVSILGSSIQMVAVPLFVLDLTRSGTAVATMTAAYMIPRIFLMPIAGVIGDRANRKFLMVSMDFLRGLLICLLALLAFNEKITFQVLCLSQVVMAAMDNLFEIPTGAMFPDIVPSELLMKANSIMGMVRLFPQLVGPAIGGMLYGFYGIAVVFLLNGISFIASAVSELFIVYRQEVKKDPPTFREIVEDLKEGFKFVWGHSSLLRMVLTFALLLNFFVSPLFNVVYPYTLRVIMKFSAQEFGILESSFVLGAFFANLLIVSHLFKGDMWKVMKVSLLLFGIPIVVFGVMATPTVLPTFEKATLFGLLFVNFSALGLLNPLINVPFDTAFQKMTPSHVRARAFSSLMLVSNGMAPLGAVMYGWLTDRVPVHFLYYGAGAVSLLIAVTFLLALGERRLPV